VRFAARGQDYREARGWPRKAPGRELLGIALIVLGEWLSVRSMWGLLLAPGGILLLLEAPPEPLPESRWAARAAGLLGWLARGAVASILVCTFVWGFARESRWAPLHPWLPLVFAAATALPLPFYLKGPKLMASPARQVFAAAGYVAVSSCLLVLFAV
jgi:hypothetical protein